MMARFIAMRILTYQTGNIGRCHFSLQCRIRREQRVQFINETFAASHQLNQSIYLMRNKPSPLPSGSFAIIIVTMSRRTWIKRCTPITIAVQSTHETSRRIKIGLIAFGKLSIFFMIGSIAQAFGKNRYAPVIVCILQCFRNRLIILVTRDITYLILPVFSLWHKMRQY